jgi:hypothetical protein
MEFKQILMFFGIGLASVVVGGLILQELNKARITPPPVAKTN